VRICAGIAPAVVIVTIWLASTAAGLGLTSLMLFWMPVALYCFLRAVEDVPHRRGMALMGWAAVGLGGLTKGPVIVIPLLILGAYLVWTRQLTRVGRLHLWSGILLTAVITLPWYVWMTWQHGRVFVDSAIGYEIVARYGYSATLFPSQSRSILWYPRGVQCDGWRMCRRDCDRSGVYCVIPESEFNLVRRIHPTPLSVIDRGAFFTIRSKRLLRSRPLEGRFACQ